MTPIDQLHVAWADSQLGGIINKTELKQAIKEIGAKQDADGGWSINQLSKWKKKGVSTPAQTDTSDAYATAYVLFVMKQSGLKDDSGLLLVLYRRRRLAQGPSKLNRILGPALAQ